MYGRRDRGTYIRRRATMTAPAFRPPHSSTVPSQPGGLSVEVIGHRQHWHCRE